MKMIGETKIIQNGVDKEQKAKWDPGPDFDILRMYLPPLFPLCHYHCHCGGLFDVRSGPDPKTFPKIMLACNGSPFLTILNCILSPGPFSVPR
jgi:hypothetical protein